ncbi:MAG: TIGR04283 family arsenosugar biosynthesis glycosyltransferase [Gammaproteobacteria bacterium]|nr:TIGR04283 family arsenosugar biosynthesis glycosyltransferase [Gammaproteobacteria bacterium]
MKLSIIIPVLNEAGILEAQLKRLQWMRHLGHELIVADGGSQDDTVLLAAPLADRVVSAPAGRAVQMNAGARSAVGDVLLFLHADTLLPDDGIRAITENIVRQSTTWGRFDVRLSGGHILFRLIEQMMNWRSRLTGIATGDQAIFIARSLFEKLGGYAAILLMEDVEMSRRLKQQARPICLSQKVVTSSRRWEQNGILKTVWLMWRLRLAYWLGADPARLARHYRPKISPIGTRNQ